MQKKGGIQKGEISQNNLSITRSVGQTIQIRNFATATERTRSGKTFRLSHIRPDSVYVAAIGYNWEPTAWQKVVDMIKYTNEQHVCCWLTEIPDKHVDIPYHSVPIMRDTACLQALDGGFEWVMLIDNDILPEPDLIMRLLKWNRPVVVPYILDDQLKRPVGGPQYQANIGLQPLWWAAFSCILISCRVLNCFPDCMPFGTANLESGFYIKLYHYGHRAWQDTDTELKTATCPSYPGDKSSLAELWRFWEGADAKRRQAPNRKPIDSKDTHLTYWPEEWERANINLASELVRKKKPKKQKLIK